VFLNDCFRTWSFYSLIFFELNKFLTYPTSQSFYSIYQIFLDFRFWPLFRDQASISSTFYKSLFWQYFSAKKFQSQNVIREKLCKAILYKKFAHKMLIKLTPEVTIFNALDSNAWTWQTNKKSLSKGSFLISFLCTVRPNRMQKIMNTTFFMFVT